MDGNNHFQEEASRIQEVYALRDKNISHQFYDPMTPSGLWNHLEINHHMLWALGRLFPNLEKLKEQEILEVGCGSGCNLLRILSVGVSPVQLHGIDLLPERIADAKFLHDGIDFRFGNATDLPWATGSMDVVLQFTCLSSVLDPNVRDEIAKEMVRVLKPGGNIISFDFVWNPINKDTVGIGKKEFKRLFPGAKINTRRVFLAPPIARRLMSHLRLFALILDSIPWLCSHRITIIKPIN